MTEKCCPECDALDILPLIARWDPDAAEYRCDDCGAHFDDPGRKEREEIIDPAASYPDRIRVLHEADPEEVPGDD